MIWLCARWTRYAARGPVAPATLCVALQRLTREGSGLLIVDSSDKGTNVRDQLEM